MIDGKLLFFDQAEAALQRSAQVIDRARITAAIVAPEPPGQAAVVLAECVEEQQAPGCDAADLPQEARELAVVEMVRDGDTKSHVESAVRKGKFRAIRRGGARASAAAAKCGQGPQIDVDEDSIQTEMGSQAACGAAYVEQPAGRERGQRRAKPARDPLPAREILNEVIEERTGEKTLREAGGARSRLGARAPQGAPQRRKKTSQPPTRP